jgi:hypothetical protein
MEYIFLQSSSGFTVGKTTYNRTLLGRRETGAHDYNMFYNVESWCAVEESV